MVAYADLVLPDTTYLERHDCISLLDRPISDADAAADAIRQPVVKPDRDVRPFQDVLIELGARLKLPGLVDHRRQRRNIPGSIPTTSSTTSASPASACSRAGAAPTAASIGSGEPNPNQLERYIANGCFWQHEIAPRARLFHAMPTRPISTGRCAMGFIDQARAGGAAALQRGAAEIPPRGRGPWRGAAARARPRRASPPISIRCRSGIARSSRQRRRRRRNFPLHAITQRPMAMYHSWGSQNAWLRQIHGEQSPVRQSRARPKGSGLADGDWVWIESPHGRVKAQIKLDGGRQRAYGLDLERHRQARRRLEPRRPRRRRPSAASCSTM